jgi:hypothetical protein
LVASAYRKERGYCDARHDNRSRDSAIVPPLTEEYRETTEDHAAGWEQIAATQENKKRHCEATNLQVKRSEDRQTAGQYEQRRARYRSY